MTAIVAESGSHLLLERNGRYAIVERRGGRIYAVPGAEREGFPDTPDGLDAAAGKAGWGAEREMRDRFAEISRRGEALARKIW